MSAGELHLTPSESEVSDLKRSISNLRLCESWRKVEKRVLFAFSILSFKAAMRSQLLLLRELYPCSTMSSDRRQEATHRRRRGWSCYRSLISVAIASQIVLLAKSFSPQASAPFSLQQRRLPGVQRISCPHSRNRSGCKFALGAPASRLDPVDLQGGDDLVQKDTPAQEHHMLRKDQILLLGLIMPLAFTGLVTLSGPGAWRYYLAGGICAAASHAIPVPIDVVKTRIQVDPKLADLHFLEATRSIIKENGVRALWAGLGPTIFGYLFEGSLKFGIYEVLKPAVKKMLVIASSSSVHLTFVNSQILAFVISGFVSGLVASAVLCPMEALRIRLVSETDFAPNAKVGFNKMLRQEGIYALWKGMLPMVYKQVPYTVTKNVSFDLITRYSYLILISRGVAMTSGIKMTIPFLSAVLASILSCVSSQPGDMLLSLVNAHQGDRRTNDIAKDILRSERGVRGFFVGINTRFLHVGITVTLQLFIYDFVKRLCGIAATGTV